MQLVNDETLSNHYRRGMDAFYHAGVCFAIDRDPNYSIEDIIHIGFVEPI